eukprot:XP_011680905.1 PREDICTED: uncharacterized protein LOC105446163 [Strongylocentrotus purpuratus]
MESPAVTENVDAVEEGVFSGVDHTVVTVVEDGIESIADSIDHTVDRVEDEVVEVPDDIEEVGGISEDDVKEVGDSIEDGLKEVGGISEDGLKEEGDSIEDGLKEEGDSIEDGLKEVGDSSEDGLKEEGDSCDYGFKEVADSIEDGLKEVADSIVHTVSRVEDGVDEVVDGIEEFADNIEDGLKEVGDSIVGLVDEIAHDAQHIIESFTFSLPWDQEGEPGSDQGNLGNNIYLPSPSPNSAPYRFGLHIKRDDFGYRIARIFQDTFAHHAKLQENDILTHLDDTDLCFTNLIEVIALFSRVGNPFSLTILRKQESGERTEIVIQFTTNIDEVERSIEIQVTVQGPRYSRDSDDPMTPYYITQDPDGGSQLYVNIASNGKLVMGHELVPFVFEKYLTIFSDGPLTSILKTTDGNRVFDFTQQKMVPFNPRRITRYIMNAIGDNDGSSVFQQLSRQSNNGKRSFLNNSNNQIVVSKSRNSVPMSGRFVLYSADDDATTTTTNGRDEGRTRHVNGAH